MLVSVGFDAAAVGKNSHFPQRSKAFEHAGQSAISLCGTMIRACEHQCSFAYCYMDLGDGRCVIQITLDIDLINRWLQS